MMKTKNWSHFSQALAHLGTCTVKQVINIVQEIVDKKGINVTVSASWWKSFKTRHKDVLLCIPETLTHSRIVGACRDQLEAYFDIFYLNTHALFSILMSQDSL